MMFAWVLECIILDDRVLKRLLGKGCFLGDMLGMDLLEAGVVHNTPPGVQNILQFVISR